MVRYKIGTPSTGNAPSCSSSSNNNINGSDSGDDQMKLIASVEMTFKSTGGAGGTIIHQKIETTTEQGSTTKLVSKSKSRSPIAVCVLFCIIYIESHIR
jgi:hypothetical protein